MWWNASKPRWKTFYGTKWSTVVYGTTILRKGTWDGEKAHMHLQEGE